MTSGAYIVTTADALCYLAQFVASGIYAVVLEFGFRRKYEPNWTWATVVWGVAQVGLIIAARLAWGPLPILFYETMAWWVWWLMFWSFCASGAPIIIWQFIKMSSRHRAVQATWERWSQRL